MAGSRERGVSGLPELSTRNRHTRDDLDTGVHQRHGSLSHGGTRGHDIIDEDHG